jgi:hypothetical protein
VKVGEQDLARSQQGHLGRLRFLDLDDEIGRAEQLGPILHQACSRSEVVGIRIPGSDAGTRFDQHGVAAFDQAVGCRGQQGHTILLWFDFPGYGDCHKASDSQPRTP